MKKHVFLSWYACWLRAPLRQSQHRPRLWSLPHPRSRLHTNPFPQGLCKSGIVKDANSLLVQITGHALSAAEGLVFEQNVR